MQEFLKTKFVFHTEGAGHRFHGVEIEVQLKHGERTMYDTMEKKDVYLLSICGHTSGCWGQCVDEIAEACDYIIPEKKRPMMRKLVGVWRDYHLNDTIPGTKKQMDCLKEFKYIPDLGVSRYDQQVAFLQDRGLLYDGEYRYGTAWLCKEIPEDVLNFLLTQIFHAV